MSDDATGADAALTALALGRPHKEVARLAAGMSVSAVKTYASTHRTEIAERRSEILEGVYGRVLAAAMGGADLMFRAATETDLPATERLSLARTGALIVDTLVRLRADADHGARLAALEAAERDRA
ncbi:hypothetical protein [Streptomyces hydrogenans]